MFVQPVEVVVAVVVRVIIALAGLVYIPICSFRFPVASSIGKLVDVLIFISSLLARVDSACNMWWKGYTDL